MMCVIQEAMLQYSMSLFCNHILIVMKYQGLYRTGFVYILVYYWLTYEQQNRNLLI